MLKKNIFVVLFMFVLLFNLFNFSFAETKDGWTLIPDAGENSENTIREVDGYVGTKVEWNTNTVWDNYHWANDNLVKHDVWLAFATWVFSWDTIFNFLKYLAKLISEIGLVIWAGMIIYAGYKYATGVFTWDASKWGKDAIKGAIYWLLIVIFSYAIMRLLLAMFW